MISVSSGIINAFVKNSNIWGYYTVTDKKINKMLVQIVANKIIPAGEIVFFTDFLTGKTISGIFTDVKSCQENKDTWKIYCWVFTDFKIKKFLKKAKRK